jgi:hypothetical protein
MSLDAVEVDLSKAFVYGQGYVALSRVRTLEGLKVNGMHPNALQVDPKIVAADTRFKAETESAIAAFDAMEQSEVAAMHERFVIALGGKVPTGEVESRQPAAVVKKESTFDQTHTLLREGKTVNQIVRARNLTESTVWNHLETLQEEGKLVMDDIVQLEPTDWDIVKEKLFAVIDEVGIEKLKPIYEGAGEEYGYDLVRLARLQYRLEERDKQVF